MMWHVELLRQCVAIAVFVSVYSVVTWYIASPLVLQGSVRSHVSGSVVVHGSSTIRDRLCTLNHEQLFRAQLAYVKHRYMQQNATVSVAFFGCDTEKLADMLGIEEGVVAVHARQGFQCTDSPRPRDGAGASAPLFDWFRELRGLVPDVLLFLSGVTPLLLDTARYSWSLVETPLALPNFGKHLIVLDAFRVPRDDCVVSGLLTMEQFTRDVVADSRVVLTEAHNLTALTIANVLLQREVAHFTSTAYGLTMQGVCEGELVGRLQRGEVEYWFLVFSRDDKSVK